MKLILTSCMDAERDAVQPVWDQIAELNPDVLMLLGDQIYMDWGVFRPDWPGTTQDPDGLEAFASAMHRRYRLQWQVASFRRLIGGLSRDPDHLLLTWDDHDFAWNNAWGGEPVNATPGARKDGTAQDPHRVGDSVKRVSHALFKQFENALWRLDMNASYPSLPSMNELLSASGDELSRSGRLGGRLDYRLLDTRWHRQGRWPGGPPTALLSNQTQAGLTESAGLSEGLLIVAAGTPMWHKGLLTHEAWCSEQDIGRPAGGLPAHREYDALIKAARRPVLFLGGDIHRNAYTGRLRHPGPDGDPSQVVQVLASGAAIARFGPKVFWPSFAEIDLSQAMQRQGQVDGRLWRLTGRTSPSWHSQALPPLPFDAQGWTTDPGGAAAAEDAPAPDLQPLQLMMARPFSRQRWKSQATLSLPFDASDVAFEQRGLDEGVGPAPLLMTATGAGGEAPVVQLSRLGNGSVDAAMTALFATAKASGGAAVFFIHGFGKSLPDAAAQGYRLRELYGCEPMVHVWEAGRAGGWFKTATGMATALREAEDGAAALNAALGAFNRAALAHPEQTSLVLARSTGALALMEALGGTEARTLLDGVDRVVLSAPLLRPGDWAARSGFRDLTPPVIVTRNRKDDTLGWGRWAYLGGKLLGRDGAFEPLNDHNLCLDFSDTPGVFDLHDYLMTPIQTQQMAVNRALMTAKAFQPAALGAALVSAGNGVWAVQ